MDRWINEEYSLANFWWLLCTNSKKGDSGCLSQASRSLSMNILIGVVLLVDFTSTSVRCKDFKNVTKNCFWKDGEQSWGFFQVSSKTLKRLSRKTKRWRFCEWRRIFHLIAHFRTAFSRSINGAGWRFQTGDSNYKSAQIIIMPSFN